MNETLCWKCENALGGCPWSKRFKPVPGWDATPTKIRMGYERIDSFLVQGCPLFIKDLNLKGYCRATDYMLASLLNESIQFIKLRKDGYLIDRFSVLGFDLKIRTIGRRRYYYISKIKTKEIISE